MDINVQLRVIIFQDCGKWIAQCLEHDICTSADTLGDLQRHLELTLCLELSKSLERSVKPFTEINKAPRHFWDLWERRSAMLTPVNPLPANLPRCEMAVTA